MQARRASGFSLIEILVVVVIVSIMVSVAVLSLGVLGDDQRLKEEARRLASLIEVAQDEALMQGREFGLEVMAESYRFVELDPFTNQWAEIVDDELLRMRTLPDQHEFSLFLEDREILLDYDPTTLGEADEDDDADVELYAPHLLIYSSGDMTPFELLLTRDYDDQIVGMRGDFLGNLEMIPDEELEPY